MESKRNFRDKKHNTEQSECISADAYRGFRVGISTFCYSVSGGNDPFQKPDLLMTHMDILREAVKLEVPVVQLCENLGLDQLAEKDLIDLREYAEKHRLKLETGCYCDSEAKFVQFMGLSKTLHADFLRIIPALPNDSDPAGYNELESMISLLKNMAAEIEKRGLTVGLENCERYSVRSYRKAVEQIGSPAIGLIVDTTNSIGRLETVETVLREMAPYAVGLHLKDMVTRRLPGKLGFIFEGAPLGEGLLDIPMILNSVRRNAPGDFSCILENWTVPAEDANLTAEREREWTEKNVRYLKNYSDQMRTDIW